MCGPCILFVGALAAVLIPRAVMRDLARLKAEREKDQRERERDDANNKPLIGGAGASLLSSPAKALQAEISRLNKLVNYDTQKPAIIWMRLQEVRQALELKQAYGNAAVWPSSSQAVTTTTNNKQQPTVLRRATTAVTVLERAR